MISNKKHSSKQVLPITYTLEKKYLATAALEGWSEVSFFKQSKKTYSIT